MRIHRSARSARQIDISNNLPRWRRDRVSIPCHIYLFDLFGVFLGGVVPLGRILPVIWLVYVKAFVIAAEVLEPFIRLMYLCQKEHLLRIDLNVAMGVMDIVLIHSQGPRFLVKQILALIFLEAALFAVIHQLIFCIGLEENIINLPLTFMS